MNHSHARRRDGVECCWDSPGRGQSEKRHSEADQKRWDPARAEQECKTSEHQRRDPSEQNVDFQADMLNCGRMGEKLGRLVRHCESLYFEPVGWAKIPQG